MALVFSDGTYSTAARQPVGLMPRLSALLPRPRPTAGGYSSRSKPLLNTSRLTEVGREHALLEDGGAPGVEPPPLPAALERGHGSDSQ